VSAYESAPGTAPIKIVPYPMRRPTVDTVAAAVPEPVVPVSYDELIRKAAIKAAPFQGVLRAYPPLRKPLLLGHLP
jgi:hypothetical protein